jgi:cytochrome c oxidase subunit III
MKKVKEKAGLKKMAFRQIEKMHPHRVLLFVTMFGSTLIFVFMVLAFAAAPLETSETINFKFPKAFVISTLVLLLSQETINRVMPFFDKGKLKEAQKWMIITLLLGLIFAICQFIGWQEMKKANVSFDSKNAGAYLYVIYGLHIIHVIAGIAFLTYLLLGCYNASKDGVKKLIYETNSYQRVKFEMLKDLWGFSNMLWLLIFLYFFLAY